MQVRKRSWYRKLPLLLIPLLIAVAALQLKERLSVPPVAPGKPLPVRVVEVAPQDIEFVRSYTARIEDRERAALSARLNSVVDAVRVREGETVRQGDLLIELDDRDVRAEMKRSMALVRQVKADLLFQEKQIVVDRELYREGGISKLELDNAERKLEGLAATLSQHESSLRLAEQKLDYTRIRAPIGGRVQSIDISEGEHAAAGRPLIEIVSRDSYKAVVALPERDMPAVMVGAVVYIGLSDGRRWQGRVDKIYPALDERTHTGTAEVYLDQGVSSRLFPGSTVRADVVLSRQADALAVPAQALFHRDGRDGLFVEQDGIARWRDVVAGDSNGQAVVIRRGLNSGDRVIVTAYQTLQNGVAVTVSGVEEQP